MKTSTINNVIVWTSKNNLKSLETTTKSILNKNDLLSTKTLDI